MIDNIIDDNDDEAGICGMLPLLFQACFLSSRNFKMIVICV
jgi:hypothetical protein